MIMSLDTIIRKLTYKTSKILITEVLTSLTTKRFKTALSPVLKAEK